MKDTTHTSEPLPGFSASVAMHLVIADVAYPLAELGPDFAVFREAVNLPPSLARVHLTVDGSTKQWDVKLPEGAASDTPRTRLAAAC